MFDTLYMGTGGEDGSIVVVVQVPVMYIAIGDLNCVVQKFRGVVDSCVPPPPPQPACMKPCVVFHNLKRQLDCGWQWLAVVGNDTNGLGVRPALNLHVFNQ